MRKRTLVRPLVLIAGFALLPWLAGHAQSPPSAAEQTEFFERNIRAVLVEHCYACHNSSGSAEGGLALDHREGLLIGGEGGPLLVQGGPLLVPGQPSRSRLIAILKHQIDGLEMPNDGPKLDDSTIADFEKWIAMGAHDPRDTPPATDELAASTPWSTTLKRRLSWWSFRPIVDPEVPPSDGHPIDRFIQRRLRETQLQPAPAAEPSTLIRRLYLTLIGLPPTASEVNDWTQRYQQAVDVSNVTAALIDDLLASEHFGERWARHWMDWIRYAESHGSEGDPAIDNAWLYRDYLIRALNADVPIDQLIREHMAGDLLESPRINETLEINESLIGTAHWRMVFHGFAPTDALDEKVRFVDDQINAFSKAFLGLTVSCARCHDHKFDAISQRDYYAIFGILAACRPGRLAIDLPKRQEHNRQELANWKPKIRRAIADAWLDSLPALPEKSLSADHVAGEQGATQVPPDCLSLLHSESQQNPIRRMRQGNEVEFREGWQQLAASVRAGLHTSERQPSQQQEREQQERDGSLIQRWDFAEPLKAATWNRIGLGLKDQPSQPGEFAIALEGDSALTGVYPAGIFSHLISDKHAARLTSPDIELATESELWLRAIGDGEASTRYVVHDFPRNGTVYPVDSLKPQWTWHRFPLSYWQGDDVHFEIVTSKDAPLLVKGPERSWFGITEVRLLKKGSPAPETHNPFLAALAEAAKEQGDPTSMESLAELYRGAVGSAIRAWRSGKASDTQAELLSACLQNGLLTNSLRDLPTVAPMVDAYRKLEAEIQAPTRVPSLDETEGRSQRLFIRGNHRMPDDLVPRRFLEAIDASEYSSQESGRKQLAEDLLRDDNPLTRRVIVNRLWHHLHGRGIVATPDNLGRMGDEPTHPELLAWLACRLVEDGWSMKSLIRRIVTSETWQQSSEPSEAATRIDPGNRLLSHARLIRLEAEAIRDSLLAASGSLDRTLYGPSVAGDANRRSIYVRVIRNSLDPFLRAFDFPEPFSATGRRDVTNVPAQSLTLMNDPVVSRWASELAATIATSGERPATAEADPTSDMTKLDLLFLTLLSRPPSDDEARQTLAYLQATRDTLHQNDPGQDDTSRELATWTEMSRAMLLLKEVIYVP